MKLRNKIFLFYAGISLIFFILIEIIFISIIKHEYLLIFNKEIENYVNTYIASRIDKDSKDINTGRAFETNFYFGKIEGIIIQENVNSIKLSLNTDFEKLPEDILIKDNSSFLDLKNHKYYYIYSNKSNNSKLILSFNTHPFEERFLKATFSFSIPLITLQIFFILLFYYSMKHTYVKPLEELAQSLSQDNSININRDKFFNKKDEIGDLSRKIFDFESSLRNIIITQEETIKNQEKYLNLLLKFISEFNLSKKSIDVINVILKFYNPDFPVKIYDIYLENSITKEELYQNLQILSKEEAKEIFDMLIFLKDNKLFTYHDLKFFCKNIPEDYVLIPLRTSERLYGFISISMITSDDLQDTFISILYHLTIALENTLLYEYTEKLSTTDPLTGVFNKRKFDEILENEIKRAQRFKHPLSILFIDIDHFKNINDLYGHIVGDSFLKEVALFLLRNTRSIDSIGRLGGEEFACILPETNLASAYNVGEKMRVKWNTEKHIIPIDIEKRIGTLSIGIANFPIHTENPKELLILADNALYMAKEERDKVFIYNKDLI
jgi:diguanylate cyclase (GGDEF)-like protein